MIILSLVSLFQYYLILDKYRMYCLYFVVVFYFKLFTFLLDISQFNQASLTTWGSRGIDELSHAIGNSLALELVDKIL